MATYVSFRDGGKTSEEGFYRPFRKILSTVGVMSLTDLAVSQRGAGANKSVDIAAGDAFFTYNNYAFYGWNTATLNDSSTVIADNSSGNPRIDAVVVYIDLTVVDSTNSNNPNALKFKVVAGTPAGSPTAPTDPTIQSSVGSGNPFLRLANVAVSNGFTSIVNANITDTRTITGLITSQVAGVQRVRAYRTANQSITNNTETPVQFDNESYDTDTMHDNVTNNTRITFTTAGIYSISGNVVWAAGAGGRRNVTVKLNGTTYLVQQELPLSSTNDASGSFSLQHSFTAGDYIEVNVYQSSGGAINLNAAGSPCYVSAFRVA